MSQLADSATARYKIAHDAYKKASAKFKQISNSLPRYNLTDAEEAALVRAKREYSVASKAFYEEKLIFLSGAKRISNVPVGNMQQAETIIFNDAMSDQKDMPWYKEIKAAAEKRAKDVEEQNRDKPVEEQILVKTDDVDVFKDIQ